MTENFAQYVSRDTWPRYLGLPDMVGDIRRSPEDFQVNEILGFEPGGEGEHTWLLIEKTGLTTLAVQQTLARHYAVASREVAFSGLKDKFAVTRQWFSVRTGMKTPAQVPGSLAEGMRCIEAVKNSRKLRRGVHKSNAFTLVIRGLAGNHDELAQRLERVGRSGVPNYFGPQRFGREGANVSRLLQQWSSGKAGRNRELAGIELSAGRSYLFNSVLAKRVEQQNWNQAVSGDCFALAGSASTFGYARAAPDELERRLAQGDIHPTGPLWGVGEPKVSDRALEIEHAVMTEHAMLAQGLVRQGLEQDRRPLRLAVGSLHAEIHADCLTLQFELTSGSYATAVLRELVNYTDVSGDA